MQLDPYMREIESLVQHLSPQASLLGDMDIHVIQELHAEGVPIEAALAGIRAGAKRLAGLKRRPRGLPLKRVRTDVRKVMKKNARTSAQATPARSPAPADEHEAWREAVREMAAAVPQPFARELATLAADTDLGAERAFVRLLAISGDYYQSRLEAMDLDARDALMEEIRGPVAPALRSMLPEARQQMLDQLARRRLAEADPVLDPDRFWQDG